MAKQKNRRVNPAMPHHDDSCGKGARDIDHLTGYDFLRAVYPLDHPDDVDDGPDWLRSSYEETGNPWYLFTTIALTDQSKESVPAWVVDALLAAATKVANGVVLAPAAMATTGEPGLRGRNGKRVFPTSMDEALGLSTKRGGRPYYRAIGINVKREIFEYIEMIRACYDVSVEKACECVYYFRDVDACVIAVAVLEEHKKRGNYKDDAEYMRAYEDALTKNDKTFGAKFGASLSTLIDKYHRDGEEFRRRAFARHERNATVLKFRAPTEDDVRNMLMARWAGELLGMKENGADAWTIPEADARKFPMRPEFRKLADSLGL